MTSIVGRGVKVEVAKTFGAAKVVTAVTQANPGVATSTAHALAVKTAGYLNSVEGMVNLEGQAGRVFGPATDTFSLEGMDTTSFPSFTGTAEFFPVTVWSTLAKATSYEIGGGAPEKLDDTALIDDIKQELAGLLASQTMTIGTNSETFNSEAMDIVENAALAQGYVLMRITLKDGSIRLCRGQPSLPGENVQRGQIGTGQFSLTVKGKVLKTPA